MTVPPPNAHDYGKYYNNGKGGYFRFDDRDKMGFNYIIMNMQQK